MLSAQELIDRISSTLEAFLAKCAIDRYYKPLACSGLYRWEFFLAGTDHHMGTISLGGLDVVSCRRMREPELRRFLLAKVTCAMTKRLKLSH